MAFAFIINLKQNLTGIFQPYLRGQHVKVSGTFTQLATDGGGAIVTGLTKIDSWGAVGDVLDKSASGTVSGGTITLAFNATAGPTTGYWWAEGVL